ncbi:hypothetical protein B0H14DRAFT_2557248 [Mycena olivaceomarginata]|nr:hypothetical protein B0H14DRAFT_2557248 [Mycena olivaceomarginata]
MPRTHVPATSTHAIRNPGKAVQQVHRRPTASGAAKATVVLQKEEARLQRHAYEQEVESFNEHRDREIARIAKKFGKTDRYVRSVLCHKSSVKTTRRKNLRNAIKYDRALKARAAGEQKSLEDYNNDLQDEIDDGAAFDEQSLGKVEYDRLMDQLEEKRQTETRGARATNKAAANDARKTSMSIGEQLTNLYERTGVRAFAVFSRGNADDDALPQAVDSDNALEFFLQEMGTDQLDVMRKFEHYSCTMDEATRKKNDAKSVRADMSKRLTKGLCKLLDFSLSVQHLTFPPEMILKNSKVAMEYTKYDIVIRVGHGVEMAGWPRDVAVERAGNMNAETVRRILRMILAGEIRWVSMSKEARAALIKEQDAQRAESGGTLLKRKERSNKGTTNRTLRDTGPTLAVVGAGSGLAVPILAPSPSVIDRNVSHTPSTTNTPPTPSTVAATATATHTVPAPTPDLNLTDLLHMPEDGLGPGLDFGLDFLGISNDMAAVFPGIVGMEPFAPGHYGDAGGPSGAVYAPDLGLPPLPRPPISPTRSVLTPLDVNMGSKRTAAHLEEVNSGAPAKKQRKRRSDAGIARGPRK